MNMDRINLLDIHGYEAEVYQALLSLGRARASEIARIVSVPRPHVYTSLRALSLRGLVTTSKGKVSIFSMVPPDTAFRRYLESERVSLKNKEAAVQDLLEIHKHSRNRIEKHEAIEVVGSEPSAYYEIQKTISNAKREVISLFGFVASQRSRKASAERADELELGLLRRGVIVRSIYSREVAEDEYERQRTAIMVRAGEQARVTDLVPSNLVVVDDTMATMSLPEGTGRPVVYRFNDPCLIQTQQLAFEQLWQNAEEFKPPKPTRARKTFRKAGKAGKAKTGKKGR